MSWLSTVIHNNSGAISGVLGAFNPALGVIAGGVLGGGSKNTSSATAGVNIMPLQGQGRPPITVDSQSRKIGIPLPGGGVIGGQETVVKRYGTQGTSVAVAQGTSLCTIPGYHLNKSKNRVTGAAAHTYCVRNRKMNFGNGRAVKRAVRRLRGFHKLAVRVEKALHIGRATSRPRARSRSCGCGR